MSLSINLSPSLTELLQNQSTSLGISINELIEKLIYRGLSQKHNEGVAAPETSTVTQNGSVDADHFTMAEIISRARSRPRNASSIHPPTGTLDDALAALKTNPPAEPLSPQEWEMHWWPIRREMRERDKMREHPIDKFIQDQVARS